MAAAQGGCMCGAVRYECTGTPLFMGNCHCRDCQRAGGGAYNAAIGVPRNAVKITGDVKYYESKADSGSMAKRGFCPNCGSRLFSLPPFAPDLDAVSDLTGQWRDDALYRGHACEPVWRGAARIAPTVHRISRHVILIS